MSSSILSFHFSFNLYHPVLISPFLSFFFSFNLALKSPSVISCLVPGSSQKPILPERNLTLFSLQNEDIRVGGGGGVRIWYARTRCYLLLLHSAAYRQNTYLCVIFIHTAVTVCTQCWGTEPGASMHFNLGAVLTF